MRRRPDRQARPQKATGKIETLLEQLRQRQLSFEQLETYRAAGAAAEKLRVLNESQAQANMQTELTNARVQVQIAESHGEADLARPQAGRAGGGGLGRRPVALASSGRADGRSGRGGRPPARIGRPRRGAEDLRTSACPKRPCCSSASLRTVTLGCMPCRCWPSNCRRALSRSYPSASSWPACRRRRGDGEPSTGLLGLLVSLLVAEKSGFQNEAGDVAMQDFQQFAAHDTASARIGRELAHPAEVTVISGQAPALFTFSQTWERAE